MAKRLTVSVVRVVERTREEGFPELVLVQADGKQQSKTGTLATASKTFEWDAPVHFDLGGGEPLPEELRISVRCRLGHSGTPEVLGFGTVDLREALTGGARRQTVQVALSRHHKRNMEAEAVITEHSGDAEVVIDVE